MIFAFAFSEPDAVMCVNANIAKPSIYDVTKKTWSAGDFEGWVENHT